MPARQTSQRNMSVFEEVQQSVIDRQAAAANEKCLIWGNVICVPSKEFEVWLQAK